jgi:hypothetical protein
MEDKMMRTASAIAVATLVYVANPAATQAFPIAPPAAGVFTDAADIVPAYYYRGGYYPYRWGGRYYHHRYYRYGRWRYY